MSDFSDAGRTISLRSALRYLSRRSSGMSTNNFSTSYEELKTLELYLLFPRLFPVFLPLLSPYLENNPRKFYKIQNKESESGSEGIDGNLFHSSMPVV